MTAAPSTTWLTHFTRCPVLKRGGISFCWLDLINTNDMTDQARGAIAARRVSEPAATTEVEKLCVQRAAWACEEMVNTIYAAPPSNNFIFSSS